MSQMQVSFEQSSVCCESHMRLLRGGDASAPLDRALVAGAGLGLGVPGVYWLCPSSWTSHSMALSLSSMIIKCGQ